MFLMRCAMPNAFRLQTGTLLAPNQHRFMQSRTIGQIMYEPFLWCVERRTVGRLRRAILFKNPEALCAQLCRSCHEALQIALLRKAD
eukprot:366410-Chlamydomonas_euryale.AAC.10